jgi:hypothetical protein
MIRKDQIRNQYGTDRGRLYNIGIGRLETTG